MCSSSYIVRSVRTCAAVPWGSRPAAAPVILPSIRAQKGPPLLPRSSPALFSNSKTIAGFPIIHAILPLQNIGRGSHRHIPEIFGQPLLFALMKTHFSYSHIFSCKHSQKAAAETASQILLHPASIETIIQKSAYAKQIADILAIWRA